MGLVDGAPAAPSATRLFPPDRSDCRCLTRAGELVASATSVRQHTRVGGGTYAETRTDIVTREAIAEAFAKAGQADHLVISPEELAAIVGLKKKTIYVWIAQGRLDGSFTKVGKHILICADKAIDTLFNSPK